jgi:hypothetical protein
MPRLRGSGLGAGSAMGTAAVIRLRGGIPLPPQPPPRIAELVATDRLIETADVVLISPDWRTALSLFHSMPWAHVVAVVTEAPDDGSPVLSIPTVTNLPHLLERVEDDMLIIVDARTGIAIIEPDGLDIAHYQGERNNLAPRRRIHIGSEHLPARTVDGRTLTVVGAATTLEDVDRMVEEGADAVLITARNDILPPRQPVKELRNQFEELTARIGGKEVLIADHYALPPEFLLWAADRTDLTVVAPPRPDLEGFGLRELHEEMAAALDDLFERNLIGTIPRIAGSVRLTDSLPGSEELIRIVDGMAANGAVRLVVDGSGLESLQPALAALDVLVTAANANLLACYIRLPEGAGDDEDLQGTEVRVAVGIGAAGIVTRRVSAVKQLISAANYSETQELVLQSLAAGGAAL